MHAKAVGQVRRQWHEITLMHQQEAEDHGGYGMTAAAWYAAQEELQRLSAQLLEIQESERRRIAIDLHDVLGQALTMIKLGVEESLQLLAANDTCGTTESLQRLKIKAKEALGEVRRVAMDLRPSTLDDLGILATLSWYFREFGAMCQNVEVEKDFCVEEGCVPTQLKIAIFRIIQEATNNIVKHANASRIKVSLKKTGNALYLSIEDDGNGFDPAEIAKFRNLNHSLGMVSMNERAKLTGGHYKLTSAPGRGTNVCVLWPLDGATASERMSA